MSKKESQALAVVPSYSEPGLNLPVTQADVEALSRQRKLFHQFIQDQLKVDVDYGVIPGTNKQSLYKPGAEKLSQLYGLGVRVVLTEKMFEREGNFALFNYRAECYVLRNQGMVVAQCEGSCNSQEKKYKERKIYQWDQQTRQKKEVGTEATPICDVLNTLQKMAQKRAIVGAVILATAASDFFTHDVDDNDDAEALGLNPNAKPSPAVIKAAIPKATSATSHDQSQAKPSITPMVQSPVTPNTLEPGGFDNFGKAAPVESIEDLYVAINKCVEKLSLKQQAFIEIVRTQFKKAPLDLTLDDLHKLRSKFQDDIQRSAVK